MMLGEKIPAAEAERFGMIYKVFTDETFATGSRNIAIQLAGMPTRALFYTKKLLQMSLVNSLEEQLGQEDVYQQKAAQTKDYKEGVTAFMEKRIPLFKGE